MSQRIERRGFLELMGAAACLPLLPAFAVQQLADASPPDLTLRISPIDLEIAPGRIVKTTGYNGSAPGPFLHFREGQQVTVEIANDTSEPEILHWHGLFLPPEVDGAEETGTPLIPAHSSQRYSFVARPAGTRWYHTHVHAGRNLKRGTYSGQFGMVYIEPAKEPGQSVHLHRHSFELRHVAGKPTAGVFKDVVVVPRRNVVEVDLIADQPGLSLLHCHQQMHMDFGFMTLLRYAG